MRKSRQNLNSEIPKITILPVTSRKPIKYITTFYLTKKTKRDFDRAMKRYNMTREDLLSKLLSQVI